MLNSMVVLTLSVLERKYRFLRKFGSKNQNCLFLMILDILFTWHLFEYAEFDGDVQLFYFELNILFFGKLGP